MSTPRPSPLYDVSHVDTCSVCGQPASRCWCEDAEGGDLLYWKPYPHERILDPAPNTSKTVLPGGVFRGVIDALIIEIGILAMALSVYWIWTLIRASH